MEYATSITTAENLVKNGEHGSCIRECGSIVEQAMKDILANIFMNSKKIDDKKEIQVAEETIGKGKTYASFGLGELVGLYRLANVWDIYKIQVTSRMTRVKKVDWNYFVEVRNEAVHNPAGSSVNHDDAMQLLLWTKALLYESELLGTAKDSADTEKSLLDNCPECSRDVDEDWSFCPTCGFCLNMTCPNCERDVDGPWKICPYCEAKLYLRAGMQEGQYQKQYEYELLCRGAWLDKIVNSEERRILDKSRLEFGLTEEEASEIEAQFIPQGHYDYKTFVEAVVIDGPITDGERGFLDEKGKTLGLSPTEMEKIEESMTNTTL